MSEGDQPQEGEQQPPAPKFDYEEKDDKKFFKKQEKIIFDAYMTAKKKKESEQPPDEENKETFNVDEWITQFVEETKHDDKIVRYVVTLGVCFHLFSPFHLSILFV